MGSSMPDSFRTNNKINFVFLVCWILCIIQEVAFAQLSVGAEAPDFILPSLDDMLNFNLSQNLGTRTIIYFWSPISELQKEQMVMLQKFYGEFSAKGVQIVAILTFPESGDRDSAIKFIRRKAIKFVNLIDDQNIFKKYGITSTPAIFVLDEKRNILKAGSDITYDLLEEIKTEIESKTIKKKTEEIGKRVPPKTPKPWREPGPPSPIPYGLAGASLNALIPGLGGVVFDGFSQESNTNGCIGISTGGFYLVGLFCLIDILTKPKDFLTQDDEKTYKNIVKIELYTTAGFYVFNIISGYLVGADYARRQKSKKQWKR